MKERDTELIYAADSSALNKHHLQENWEITGYSPVHMLCMKNNPSVTLLKSFMIMSSKSFYMSTSYNNEDPAQYGRYPLHLVAEDRYTTNPITIGCICL